MNIRDLVPWVRNERERPPTRQLQSIGSVINLHQEMNRLFDDVFRAFDASRTGGVWPSIDVEETKAEYRVTAEIPGLAERDIEILYQDGVLTLRGEKKLEKDGEGRSVRERVYGRFERTVLLDREVEEESIRAAFRDGLLTVTLPKDTKAEEAAKRIEINTEGTSH